jgi:D-alanine-D-alanine ligase
VKARTRPRIAVIYNRDFEGAEADPENKAREDVKEIADHIARILNANGYEASGLGVTSDVTGALSELRALKPAAVFNLCESIHGDNRFESLLPLLLELERIPYTGSEPFALSLALRKEKVKEILRACGVPAPRGCLVSAEGDLSSLSFQFPLIVKPAREDASVGITRASVVSDEKALTARVLHILYHYHQPALVEEYIEGREIYVSLLGQVDGEIQVFPFFEIDFSAMPADRPKIVSFEGKWVEDSIEYKGTRPVRCEGLSPEMRDKVAQTALAAFHSIGLRDYARMDIRLSADGTPYVIDVNPNCDLSDLAGGFSRAAKTGGLSYKDVILRLVSLALCRCVDETPIPLAQPPGEADLEGESESLPTGGGFARAGVRRGGARSQRA